MNKKENKRPLSLTGIRASGSVHIGNYLGMIQPAIARQEEYDCLYFIADLHALTTIRDPKRLRESTLDVVATFIACGLDVQKFPIYRSSDVAHVTEFTWYLSCVTGMGLLEKGHAYKDAVATGKEVNHGLFAYPVLMAADIVMYDADIVPVGKDQKQHVEMARDIAGSFNAVYGADIIKLPVPVIEETVMTIPGLDGRKMSKSYDNYIPLFCSSKDLRKFCMSVVTDSTPLEAPKSMKGTALGDLFVLFSTADQFQDLENRLNKGGIGWGHAKDELYQMIEKKISPMRDIYVQIAKDTDMLLNVLKRGKERASDISLPVLERVRKAVGMR